MISIQHFKRKTILLDSETSIVLAKSKIVNIHNGEKRAKNYCYCGWEFKRIRREIDGGWMIVCSRTNESMIKCYA